MLRHSAATLMKLALVIPQNIPEPSIKKVSRAGRERDVQSNCEHTAKRSKNVAPYFNS